MANKLNTDLSVMARPDKAAGLARKQYNVTGCQGWEALRAPVLRRPFKDKLRFKTKAKPKSSLAYKRNFKC